MMVYGDIAKNLAGLSIHHINAEEKNEDPQMTP